jgi:hypothetical protein
MGRLEGAGFVLKVFFEERVEAKVGPESGPIICVNKIIIILMDNINIPAHQPHEGGE